METVTPKTIGSGQGYIAIRWGPLRKDSEIQGYVVNRNAGAPNRFTFHVYGEFGGATVEVKGSVVAGTEPAFINDRTGRALFFQVASIQTSPDVIGEVVPHLFNPTEHTAVFVDMIAVR